MKEIHHRADLKLLLVEDSDTEFLLLERKMLKLLSPVHIDRASNGSELIKVLKEQRYDLIISDFHIPEAEGEALLNMIADAQPATPCILMSGSSYEFASVRTPPSVVAKLEKGDADAFQSALQKACLSIGISLNGS